MYMHVYTQCTVMTLSICIHIYAIVNYCIYYDMQYACTNDEYQFMYMHMHVHLHVCD